MKLFSGLCAFPITPLNDQAEVDSDAFTELVRDLCLAQVDSLGVLGSTGLYTYLDRTQRRRAIGAAVRAADGKVPVMVGIGALRTDTACTFANDAAEEGADALLLAPVSYTPLVDEEVFEHFNAVASATALPLCIYNNPTTTNFRFSMELLERLACLPTVKAVKMPLPASGDLQGELGELRGLPSEKQLAVGYSGDWGAVDALLAGADAWFSVTGGIYPYVARALTRRAQAGDRRGADELNRHLEPLWELLREFGGLRVVHSLATNSRLPRALLPRPLLPLPPPGHERVLAIAPTLDELELRLRETL